MASVFTLRRMAAGIDHSKLLSPGSKAKNPLAAMRGDTESMTRRILLASVAGVILRPRR